MELDEEYFYIEFMDLSSSHDDEDDETVIMMVVFEEMENAEEHVLNFKGSALGH